MRTRVLLSLLAASIAAVALVSSSGAATWNAQRSARIDVSTRAAVVHYLRSMHVDPKGVVIQRGARNYAGSSCPGRNWTCTSTRHPVVQVASPGGKNTFSCATAKCSVLQVSTLSPAATNTAKCVKTSGLLQVCVIIQLSSSANNLAVVYEKTTGTNGVLQAAASDASIIQRATGASNTNTACVYQEISLTGSKTVGGGSLGVWLGAHQNVTIRQDSKGGGNTAAQSATSGGQCTGGAIAQNQTLTSIAKAPKAITQDENSANLGANVIIDVEQNQSPGFLGSAHGPNSARFNQTNTLTAVANTPQGSVHQTQSSVNGGILGTINQDSRDQSTATATQTEKECADAATPGENPLSTCHTSDTDAPSYSLTQTQYGPVRKGVGTATQTGNGSDTFTVNQSSQQDNDTGSGQTNVVQGDCSTDGNCTVAQNTDINGNQSSNTQSGSDVNTSTDCTGSSCTSTCNGDSCTTFTWDGSQLTATNTEIKEFGYGGMRANTAGGPTGDGTGSIAVTGITGAVSKALLYWNGPTSLGNADSNAVVNFAGNVVTGTNIGTASSNCWEPAGYTNSQSYMADVTGVVTGNGSYSLANFVKTDGTTVTADINGAALVIFYNDGDPANWRNVVLWGGNDSNVASGNDPAGWNETLTGVPGSSSGGSLDLVVSDGQSFPDDAVLVNGTTIVGAGNVFEGDSTPHGNADANGDLWDIKTWPLPSSLLTASSNTLNITSGTNQDCLSLVVAAANVPASAPSPIP